MSNRRYVVTLDQGTTSSRCVIFDNNSNVVEIEQKEYRQIYPKPGWVEHDAMEIYATQYSVMTEAVARAGIKPHHIDAIGITNQRETTIVWDKHTGKPVYNAIVWQCRRTADIIEKVKADGLTDYIKENTGLVPDAYFSASKIKWILDNVEGAREEAEKGNLLFGTVDTWLIWKLTNGKVHATDYTNASRTMIFNVRTLKWDEKLCKYFGIPMSMLPEVKFSSDDYGTTNLFGTEVQICGVAGDQQSSLFGQACFDKGDVKNTYGTGCFLLMNIGNEFVQSKNGLVTTIAATSDKTIQYALEGSVFIGGAVVQWVRDQLRFVTDAADSEYFAIKAHTNNGVYVVPAFTGLGAPYWDMYARGTIFGLTRGTTRSQITRACLESIAYQSMDLLFAMEKDSGVDIKSLKVDGGASKNNFLMQFQAEMIDAKIQRSAIMETTALGACYLAGLYKGTWKSLDEIRASWKCDKEFSPVENRKDVEYRIKKWHKAVKMCMGWEKDE